MADFERHEKILIGDRVIYTSKWHSYWYEVDGIELDIRIIAELVNEKCAHLKNCQSIKEIMRDSCRVTSHHLGLLKEVLKVYKPSELEANQEKHLRVIWAERNDKKGVENE